MDLDATNRIEIEYEEKDYGARGISKVFLQTGPSQYIRQLHHIYGSNQYSLHGCYSLQNESLSQNHLKSSKLYFQYGVQHGNVLKANSPQK
jgi:hypothetical protein